jgi:hypothetical protein
MYSIITHLQFIVPNEEVFAIRAGCCLAYVIDINFANIFKFVTRRLSSSNVDNI